MLKTVNSYKYLGLLFNYNGKFKQAKNDLLVRGTGAMFTVLCKARSFNLRILVHQTRLPYITASLRVRDVACSVEFRLLCLEGSVMSFHPQEVLLAQFSLYMCTKVA